MKNSVAIVGCGKVGTALAKHLKAADYRLEGIATRTPESSERAAGVIGKVKSVQVPAEITREADIIFITTPDGVISSVCKEIAEAGGFKKGAVILHCSGAHPSTILSPAKKTDASIGSMHPVQSFAADGSGNTFEGVAISVEGDEDAVCAARKIAEDLGAISFDIRTEAKTLYHASAVVACNYLVTLQGFAFKLMEEAGIAGKDVYKVLSPLIRGTLSNIENVGIEKGLTGPIARGDTETVQRHIGEIREKMPEFLSLYKILGLHTVTIAVQGGTLSDSAAEELKKILFE